MNTLMKTRPSNNPRGRALRDPDAGKRVPRTYKISPKTDDLIRWHSERRGISQAEVIDLAIESL